MSTWGSCFAGWLARLKTQRRVGAAILFESTGVATDRAAHLPEIRFALGEHNLVYPAALVRVVRKPGRTLREKGEAWLAWKRVAEDLNSGVLGAEFEQSDRGEVTRQIKEGEEVLRRQIPSFVERGEFGLGSGPKPDGGFERIWWKEHTGSEEVVFDDNTFLLMRTRAAALKAGPPPQSVPAPTEQPIELVLEPPVAPPAPPVTPATEQTVRLYLRGAIPPEQWNKLGTKPIPKLRTSGQGLSLTVEASLDVAANDLSHVESDLRQALRDLGLEELVQIEKKRI